MKKHCVTILLFLAINNIAAAELSDQSIVRVYARKNNSNVESGGTGFFIKLNGKAYICTAYHVIQGFESIDVEINNGTLTNFAVAAYDDEKDIAIISFDVVRILGAIPALELKIYLPSNLTELQGSAIGHLRNLEYSHVKVDFLSNSFRSSNSYDEFRYNPDFKLLQISTTIEDGLSGAPILLNNSVLGVISGSWNTGGSVTWAIPSMYVQNIRILSTPIKDIRNLPPLRMLKVSPKIHNLHSREIVAENHGGQLEALSTSISTARRDNSYMREKLNDQARYVNKMLNVLETSSTAAVFKDFSNLNKYYDPYMSTARRLREQNSQDIDAAHLALNNFRNSIECDNFEYFLSTNGTSIQDAINDAERTLTQTQDRQYRAERDTEIIGPQLRAFTDSDGAERFRTLTKMWASNQLDMVNILLGFLDAQEKFFVVYELERDLKLECAKN